MTKTLTVPYIPSLDGEDKVDQILAILDNEGVRRSIASLNWPDTYPYSPLTTFTIAHTGKNLYIDFFVRCNYLRACNYTNQSPVSQDSCVEFFVSPTSDSHYWNFEFNCIGAINASHRSERHNPTRLNADELNRVIRVASCGTKPFCEMEGIFSWNLLVKIPLDLIGVKYQGVPFKMTGNFYKCASATSAPHYLSWNPINSPNPDFHRPDDFGEIILA